MASGRWSRCSMIAQRVHGRLDGGRLAPVAGVADHDRAGRRRPIGGLVGAAVIGHDHQIHRRQPAGRGDGGRDPLLLVLGRDDAGHAGGGRHRPKVNGGLACPGLDRLTAVPAAGVMPEEPALAPRFGVRSEVGRLRTVMLHRPGNELRRLTPRNNDALLFDGLPWVDRAQDEHDAFADALRTRGVEVLYLSRLLIETMADPDARARAIELTLTDIRLGDTLRSLPARLPHRPGSRRPGRGDDGRAPQRRGTRDGQPGRRPARLRPLPDRPAAQPAVHPGLQRLGAGPGDDHLAGHARPPAGDPADRTDLFLPSPVRRRRADPRLGEGVPGRRRCARPGRRGARRRGG